jgi:hypothetical protein
METTFFNEVFPVEIMKYFEVKDHQVLCSVAEKLEYWLIDFDEKNEIPGTYPRQSMNQKDLLQPVLFRTFPFGGKEFICAYASGGGGTSKAERLSNEIFPSLPMVQNSQVNYRIF